MPRAMFAVDLQLNPFTRDVDDVGRFVDKRYDDNNFYGIFVACEIKTAGTSVDYWRQIATWGEVHHPTCYNANPNHNTNPNLNPNTNLTAYSY